MPLRLIVLLNAMVPAPGETGHEWWVRTGHGDVLPQGADLAYLFFHDVPREVVDDATARGAPVPSGRPFDDPHSMTAWPDVPTRFLQGVDDRFFPLDFQRRVVAERPGDAVRVDDMPGGHLIALSRPVELADRLEAYPATPT